MIYLVWLQASKSGSIGQKYNIHRDYRIEAHSPEQAQEQARQRAYNEGLEHTLIIKVEQLPNPPTPKSLLSRR